MILVCPSALLQLWFPYSSGYGLSSKPDNLAIGLVYVPRARCKRLSHGCISLSVEVVHYWFHNRTAERIGGCPRSMFLGDTAGHTIWRRQTRLRNTCTPRSPAVIVGWRNTKPSRRKQILRGDIADSALNTSARINRVTATTRVTTCHPHRGIDDRVAHSERRSR